VGVHHRERALPVCGHIVEAITHGSTSLLPADGPPFLIVDFEFSVLISVVVGFVIMFLLFEKPSLFAIVSVGIYSLLWVFFR
jgi:hypothetical protein